MKYNLYKKLVIEATLDSSEAIMLQQGGLHSVKLKTYNKETAEDLYLDHFDEIEITFQIEKSQFSRFDFVTSEAKKHRALWDEINDEETRKEAKLRMEGNLATSKKSKGLKGAIITPPTAAESSSSSQKPE